ncbi:MAG: peroxiredoxin [Xanthobacteraceae bacterium]|nr:peroxiredoxin [Xanthobacteraceae bacterium]
MSKKMQKKSPKSRCPAKAAAHSSTANPSIGPAQGDSAPAFSLPSDGGGIISLADFAGRKLVLFFYPRAGTPGCTIEAKDFSRLAPKFTAVNTVLLGISADPLKALAAFRKKNLLKIPLVTDEDHIALEAYGVWDKKSMYGKVFYGVVRTTFLIDETGHILQIWRKVKVNGHVNEVLTAAKTSVTHAPVS